MSEASPYVGGRRIILPCRAGNPVILGRFSNHYAAVTALVHAHQPDFENIYGDTAQDLKEEALMEKRLANARKTILSRGLHKRG